jgi:hypothetical protein
MKFLGLLLVFLLYPSLSWAHNFKLDSYGCHNNGALNVYECHDGVMKGKSWANPGGKTKMLVELNTPPPSPPSSFSLSGDAVLTWEPPIDGVTVGYWLYWGVESGKYVNPIQIPLVTSLHLPVLLKGATYYFALVAFDAKGRHSLFSNEASKEIK